MSGAPRSSTFSREFRLGLDCCRTSFGGETNAKVARPTDVDWTEFLRLVRFHRIEGLAWNGLRESAVEPPTGTVATLSQAASTIAAQNLVAAAECQSLLESFDSDRVALLFLKGVTLGALAYGNTALKSAIDIDLLIDPADLRKAAGLLRDRGFQLIAPSESPNDAVLHAWHSLWKESVWTKSSPRLRIDLHTRTADSRRLIPSIDVHSPRQLVEVGNGICLPTLAREELFAYLCVHGASSAWFRLKWMSDFAALLNGCDSEEIERLYRRSQELRSGRAAALALLLADRLFCTLQSAPSLRRELERDPDCQRLFRIALRLLKSSMEPTERRWGTLPIHRTQFGLMPGLGFKFSELTRQTRQMLSRSN